MKSKDIHEKCSWTHNILAFLLSSQILERHIKREPSCASEHHRDRDCEKKEIVVDAVGEEFLVANLEAEFDYEDDGVDECGDLSPETDDEEDGDEDLDATIDLGVATRAATLAENFLIAEICEGDAKDNAQDKWCELLV